jgi:hypothetical protein
MSQTCPSILELALVEAFLLVVVGPQGIEP